MRRVLFKSQKDIFMGVPFPHINSNMKIVLHLPEELYGDKDNGDICSGRWMAWYRHVYSQSFWVYLSKPPPVFCATFIYVSGRKLIYTPVKFNFKQWVSHSFSLLFFIKKKMINLNSTKQSSPVKSFYPEISGNRATLCLKSLKYAFWLMIYSEEDKDSAFFMLTLLL